MLWYFLLYKIQWVLESPLSFGDLVQYFLTHKLIILKVFPFIFADFIVQQVKTPNKECQKVK